MSKCKVCGMYDCKKHGFLLGKVREVKDFSGSSPPEVFVGRWNYPNVYVGILSPEEYGDTKVMSSAEEWFSKRMKIPSILNLRQKLIYARNKSKGVKSVRNFRGVGKKFLGVMREVAMTDKSIATEVKLKKSIKRHDEKESKVPLISNAGEVDRVRLQENPKVKRKVDYLVNDVDVKSVDAMIELEKADVGSSEMIKLLSAGLLGLRKNRKLVPTRWSITAVDSSLSEKKIDRIRHYPEVKDYMVFSEEYLGNHYEILLIPRYWSFEVVEISMKNYGTWRDFESIFKRKKYASDVTGAYYANRLAVCEYLEKIRRSASVLIFREIRPEYSTPLGVGILREITRAAMRGKPGKFDDMSEALKDIKSRLKISIDRYLGESQLIKEMRQKTLRSWF